ncbi:MAG: tRNA 2-thiouridine(34) synthase MnmA, partial [Candidatus Liptonbacteria bacterium]|nr:tRNA 2-thiouridine(34) synthase MnmA [Candidatus Liptonbacteria bacterium]
ITLGGGPYFVVKKDMKKNIITVGSERDLQQRDLRVMRVHSVRNRKLPATLEVKIRYRTQAQPARLEKNILKFRKPQRAITPGQSAVLYKGSEVLGGAIIA